MPNVTISVSEQLKTEMDTLSEVSWSEICRNAISRYIAQRKNPTPSLELTIQDSRLTHYNFDTGYPTLTISLRIYNKTDSEVTVDRILSTARFLTDDGRHLAIGSAYDLRKKIIKSNSFGSGRIHLILPKEKIAELDGIFKSTFSCRISCIVFVEGFKNEYNQEINTRIPIDDWKTVLKQALAAYQATHV